MTFLGRDFGWPADRWTSRTAIREELFGVERLEEHARSLAIAQQVRPGLSGGNSLAHRLDQNGAALLACYRTLVAAAAKQQSATPSAEWLIDNYYLVEQQIQDVHSDLPANYYRLLPKLLNGPFAAYPRVFGVAWAFIAHTDSRFDPDTLRRYVRAYQEAQPLTIAELWAVSITLRIVLIENLRRVAEQIVRDRTDRHRADSLADRLLATNTPATMQAILTDQARAPLSDVFSVQLLYRLRDQDPGITPALTWLDERLAAADRTADTVVRDVHRGEGAVNVTVRNIITSLRAIADADWQQLFEQTSLVDDVLAADGSFAQTDFATRTLYRSAIENLSRRSHHTELAVSEAAVQAARAAAIQAPPGEAERWGDPGYHLLAGGRRAFEASIGFRSPLGSLPQSLNRILGVSFYAFSIMLGAASLLALALWITARNGLHANAIVMLGALGIIPAVDAAVPIVNRAFGRGFGATLLPALALRDGIPPHLRSIVAVPTLLTTADAIATQVERLEVHYLASPPGDLQFALLSDWTDAATEHTETDAALLAIATEGIARINQRHGAAPAGPRFLLLHRRRIWNDGESCWMGWERKRGKLHELNRLLRGATDTSFTNIAATSVPDAVRYVITLDADTRLPRDAVRRLIGKLAHPLNRACFDAESGRVVDGYAVLQPSMTASLPLAADGSVFQRAFSSLNGIDPYAAASSDIYQDLFGEGSYAGKGIYDIDAFEASLAGRVPDNALLSHDLFEGMFARTGLASDIDLVEDFPQRYDVAAMRHHRWARGDWQLLPWILGRGPGAPAARAKNRIAAVGRWKMVDNLRRTLSAPVTTAALLAGVTLPFRAALAWTLFVLATNIVPPLMPLLGALHLRSRRITVASHLRARRDDLLLVLTLSGFTTLFLAHQAWLMADAIGRTLWRLAVTRKHLLEWLPAAQASLSRRPDLAGFYRRMAAGPIIGIGLLLVAIVARRDTWMLAAPLAAAWLLSPAVARWISIPSRLDGQPPLAAATVRDLRLVARRTWRFFETFVTAAENMLPPDNFQDSPAPVIAHRTSPTNIGLYLLSVVSARDFGWIGTGTAIARLEATLATLGRLERHRGHLLNWYETSDLRALEPRYVSTVDSGNLAGHLIALANACDAWQAQSPHAADRLAGATDAILLLRAELDRLHDGHRTQTVTWEQLDAAVIGLARSTQGAVTPPQLAALTVQAEMLADMAKALWIERGEAANGDLVYWAQAVLDTLASHAADLHAVTASTPRLAAIAATARANATGMDFAFLYDERRKLLSIGYSVGQALLDTNCYDLLASEARLASFFAIAKDDLPARHWFRLGRAATPVSHRAALISWSGSMFEYLMPSLVMRAPAGSLLDQTNRLAVRRQIDYANGLGLPWGISEAAYNARDIEFTYQYSNFGVPGLGLKRGLGDDRVIAPYATALATMVDPAAAATNFTRLAAEGAAGRYGFYESLDYTPGRVPEGAKVAVVHNFMAHHQGMTIVAVCDTLFDGIMRTRFHAEPMIQATELLLQERVPREVSLTRPWPIEARLLRSRAVAAPGRRRFTAAQQSTPATHMLSNGRYTTMLTAAGSGYSRWGDLAITRWREDATCDDAGSYIFLRDVRSGEVWSAGLQPVGAEPESLAVVFTEDRAEFVRTDAKLITTMEVLVSAEDDAEVRQVTLRNISGRSREIDVTSYAELVLAPQPSDTAHPAFSKLFVQTEYLADIGVILATRRRRAPTEPEVWAAHFSVVDSRDARAPQIETDRARFLGRGRGVRTPIAIIDGRALSGTVGTVLDPIFAMRRRVRILAGADMRVAFWTVVATSRADLLAQVDRHRGESAFSRAAMLAWTQGQVELHHLAITAGQAALFQRLAGYVIHATPTWRPASDSIVAGAGPQSALWAQAISGDRPIVLVRIADLEHLGVVREAVQAHEYWRMKQLAVDLVILNERQSSYVQDLQIAIETLTRTAQSRPRPTGTAQGEMFVLRADLIPPATRALLGAVARVVLVAQRGSLFDQMERLTDPTPAARRPPRQVRAQPAVAPILPPLEFFNGIGGFARGGKEYVTVLAPGLSTPAPWINVIANPQFGFQVAAEGSGYTWSVNSREHQLTPWSNDPVSDRAGEAFYLRDEGTGREEFAGAVWSPTAWPIREPAGTYVARHGRGYSRFEYDSHGILSDLVQFVPPEGSVKISRLRLVNQSGRHRTLSLTAYVEWVLGPSRAASAPFIATMIDPVCGAMFAQNRWSAAFGDRVAFLDLRGGGTKECTGDRREFIGRNGTLADPEALAVGTPLSGKTGAGLDPCAAFRTRIEMPIDATIDIVVLLGDAEHTDAARALVAGCRSANLDSLRLDVARQWDDLLDIIEVKTPVRAMDIMLNGWLLYQTIACRLWARAAFYQASGAYGFRDQLQDGMAVASRRPAMTREHLLAAAGRQFPEGDVQHWWLPHSGQGVRTRISDDRAWLATTVAHYIRVTGDTAILDESIPFLEGPALEPNEHDRFFLPTTSTQTATLFEHCARALDDSLPTGSQGLPLMGTGDWNDGMNRVGELGQGESVWLAWLLHSALNDFAPLARTRAEDVRADLWQSHAHSLSIALEAHAWDGAWYRRAYFDDGTPLGSTTDDECRIDAIAQSWAVLSGAADPARAGQAMDSVHQHLIRPDDGLALLFTPPFDKTKLEPGYIKGYPPGIRENGGQYSHAAMWSIMAFAKRGDGDRAAALFALLNPINHAANRADMLRYKVEPYVIAADVYSVAPHVGRGGWTWYTGSAAWMHRAGLESILGVHLYHDSLHLDPCIPAAWPSFEITLRHRSARYRILVENPRGQHRGIRIAQLDGTDLPQRPLTLQLLPEGEHLIRIELGDGH